MKSLRRVLSFMSNWDEKESIEKLEKSGSFAKTMESWERKSIVAPPILPRTLLVISFSGVAFRVEDDLVQKAGSGMELEVSLFVEDLDVGIFK